MLPACLAARPRCAVSFDFDNTTKHMYMQDASLCCKDTGFGIFMRIKKTYQNLAVVRLVVLKIHVKCPSIVEVLALETLFCVGASGWLLIKAGQYEDFFKTVP